MAARCLRTPLAAALAALLLLVGPFGVSAEMGHLEKKVLYMFGLRGWEDVTEASVQLQPAMGRLSGNVGGRQEAKTWPLATAGGHHSSWQDSVGVGAGDVIAVKFQFGAGEEARGFRYTVPADLPVTQKRELPVAWVQELDGDADERHQMVLVSMSARHRNLWQHVAEEYVLPALEQGHSPEVIAMEFQDYWRRSTQAQPEWPVTILADGLPVDAGPPVARFSLERGAGSHKQAETEKTVQKGGSLFAGWAVPRGGGTVVVEAGGETISAKIDSLGVHRFDAPGCGGNNGEKAAGCHGQVVLVVHRSAHDMERCWRSIERVGKGTTGKHQYWKNGVWQVESVRLLEGKIREEAEERRAEKDGEESSAEFSIDVEDEPETQEAEVEEFGEESTPYIVWSTVGLFAGAAILAGLGIYCCRLLFGLGCQASPDVSTMDWSDDESTSRGNEPKIDGERENDSDSHMYFAVDLNTAA